MGERSELVPQPVARTPPPRNPRCHLPRATPITNDERSRASTPKFVRLRLARAESAARTRPMA